MGSVLLVAAAGFFWLLTLFSFGTGGGSLVCAMLPIAVGMTFVSWQVFAAGRTGFGEQARTEARVYDRTRSSTFRVVGMGRDYVDFQHPEGGSWSYGMSDDLRAVNGVEVVESMGGGRYRMYVSRDSSNAARVLEAAYQFRTGPKAVEDGVVYLNDCPGYDVLLQEASYDLG